MASLKKSRTIFGFTSPRTLEKIIPEIALLNNQLCGQPWNSKTQASFYKLLQQSDFFEESTSQKKDPAFSARDRINRAPKALGFISLKPTISLTKAGEALVSGKRIQDTITRQLMKFQLPSPYHTPTTETNFRVRPYLELLRLVYDLKEVSKTEVSIFFTQLVNFELYEEIKSKISLFRKRSSENRSNRKTFVLEYFKQEVLSIYNHEISNNEYRTRESDDNSLNKFLNTKISNMKDYADAFIRYIRATQLVTFDKKSFKLIISPYKIKEVEYLLNNIERNPIEFSDIKAFETYMFDNNNVKLLYDNKNIIMGRLDSLQIPYNPQMDIEQLYDLLEIESNKIIEDKIQTTKIALKEFKEYDDVIDIFKKIKGREVPDPPLYLEWNIWRAFVMLNYTKSIVGNFKIDYDGVPLNTAAGNKPDIEIEYDSFKIIVEVTMSTGQTQYNMEGEPVARHYGNIRLTSEKDVFCIFIAPKISDATLAHFFNLNRLNTRHYGGKTKIIPMDLESFLKFLEVGKNKKFNNPQQLHQYLNDKWLENQTVEDEVIWFDSIKSSIPLWLN